MHERYAAWAARWRVPLGFALGIAYLILSQPTVRVLIAGGCLALVGLLVRGWSAGYLDKNRKLATAGPYAYTRNPLYLGSCLMGAGFVVAAGSWVLAAAFGLLVLLIYWPVMRREERSLRQQFDSLYAIYAARVPFFFPRLVPNRSPSLAPGRERRSDDSSGKEFRWERYRQNREYEAALGYGAGVVFLALKIALR